MYTPWPDNSNEQALRSQLADLVGDYIFDAPSFEVADIHSQFAQVYVYQFAHRSKVTLLPEWMGVAHGENVVYDFGIPMLSRVPLRFDAIDRNMSLVMMAMYADFARSGTPKVSGITWEKYDSTNRAYLRVDTDPKMTANFYPLRMSFWNDYYIKLTQVKFDTKKDAPSVASTVVTMATFVQIILITILTTL